jgi:hypothetical protein
MLVVNLRVIGFDRIIREKKPVRFLNPDRFNRLLIKINTRDYHY